MANKLNYLIRHAAGMYWIIKADQRKEYIRPVATNECGAILWERIEKGSSVKELSVLLQRKYGIGPEEALADVNEFLDQLIENGMEAYLKEKGILK
ncbi:MAG: PqqD family protein [Thermoclostridium sp.]|nr:PqqD family protein [Thermoclostridium sp.]